MVQYVRTICHVPLVDDAEGPPSLVALVALGPDWDRLLVLVKIQLQENGRNKIIIETRPPQISDRESTNWRHRLKTD